MHLTGIKSKSFIQSHVFSDGEKNFALVKPMTAALFLSKLEKGKLWGNFYFKHFFMIFFFKIQAAIMKK